MVKSLQHRLVLYLLVPVAVILLGLAFFGFFSIRQHLLQAWEESALLKLERAADTIDRRLNRLKSWIERFHATGQNPNGSAIQEWLLQQLQEEEGVNRVTLTWTADPPSARSMPMMPGTGRPVGMGSRRGMMRFHRGRIAEVSPPHYDAQAGQETLSLISHLTDETGRTLGTLEVVIRFDALIAGILTRGWGEGTVAGLVDDTGRYLAHTDPQQKGRQLGDTGDPVEKATLAALQTQRVGTLFGSGHPPQWVSGFYRLQAAPWTVVLFAPGQTVLAPIIRFLISYVLIGLGGIGGILLLIRLVVGPIVSSIRVLSQAAEQVAQGKYNVSLPVNSRDEIGQLIHSFHTMVNGLKERDFLSNTFGRYVDREIARELLRRPAAARLGGERREVAILISDLRRFTPLAESLSPEATISLLNRYFAAMIEVIQQHRGIIVDFFGDGILVFFDPWNGAVAPAVERAVRCAIEMQRAMERFRTEIQAEQVPQLEMGIGVNAGEVVVGNIGSETRAKYGIVGSAVNITQRIQTLAEGGEVVISETVYRYIQAKVKIKATLRVQLKGVQQPVTLYKVDRFADIPLSPALGNAEKPTASG